MAGLAGVRPFIFVADERKLLTLIQPVKNSIIQIFSPEARWPLYALMVAAVALYAAFIFSGRIPVAGQTYFCLFDDAMISMRYARHLADGLGLVWNPGEPPIEGFTNLLWTLVMTGIHWLPIRDAHTSLAIMILGAALMLANGAAAWNLAGALSRHAMFAKFAAAALTLFCYPLMFWTLRGMEVGLLALLVTVMAWQTLRLYHLMGQLAKARRALAIVAMCMVVALLTRPDAIVPVIVTGFFVVCVRPGSAMRWRAALLIAGVVIGVTGGLTLWRLLYFGDTLPNTYYLKMTGIPLWRRVANGAEAFHELMIEHRFWLPVILVLAGLVWAASRRALTFATLLLAALPASMIAYSIYVGGDAWEAYEFPNRYIAITLPVMFALIARFAGEAFDSMTNGRAHRAAVAAPWIILAFILIHQNYTPYSRWLDDGYEEQRAHAINTRMGLILRAGTAPDALIVVYWAGAIPYFSQRPTIDLLGKNDRVIARQPAKNPNGIPGHTKWDYHHSFGDGRPNVVAQLWRRWKEDYDLLAEAGYMALPSGIYVHPDDPRVDEPTLSTDCRDALAVDAALSAAPYPWR